MDWNGLGAPSLASATSFVMLYEWQKEQMQFVREGFVHAVDHTSLKTDDAVGHFLALDEHSDWELVYDFEKDACPDMNVRAHRRGDAPDAEPIAWFNPRTNKSSFGE